ncbi:MAG TPA: TetR/AcrR family transcriptional regulator [Ruminiclostridium sp.]|nr:TetR/AcrR family transcriptional regulator [Ruminiclostridium sp.]
MKNKIIKATSDTISKVGFRGFIIDDICTYLGISKKTVYKYFANKTELINAVIESNLNADRMNTLEAIQNEESWPGRIKAAILFHHITKIPINLLDELRRLYPESWNRFNDLREFKKNLIRDLIKDGIKQKYLKADVSPEIILLLIDSSIPCILNYDFLAKNDINVNQATEEMMKIIFYGITIDK